MIQRIQSLFLVDAITALVFMFFVPFFQIVPADKRIILGVINGILQIHPGHIKVIVSGIPFIVLTSLSIALSALSLFMFKNRELQMKLGKVNLFSLLGLVALLAYYAFTSKGQFLVNIGIFLPLLAFIFISLANYFIQKDEKLIKSLDRIR